MTDNEKSQLAAAPLLAEGLLGLYQPELKKVKDHLVELTKKQEVICREMHSENLRVSEAQYNPELNHIFTNAKVYREKLVNLKKKMIILHDRSTKLKKRALKLEQSKQQEAIYRVQQREREEQLIGKSSQS